MHQGGPEKTLQSLFAAEHCNRESEHHGFQRNVQKLIDNTKTEKILILRFNILGLN